jgi:hypothetical protein
MHYLIDPDKRQRHIPHAEKRICSCGKTLTQCPLWSSHLERLKAGDNNNFSNLYKQLLRDVAKLTGDENTCVCDSSKYRDTLRDLLNALPSMELTKNNIRVLHVIKDVRGYVLSQRRSKKGSRFGDPKRFYRWRKENTALEKMIAREGLNSLRIGYEELCFYPAFIMKKIADFIELDFDLKLLDPSKSQGHMGVGNPMRAHPRKSKAIYYDHRWFLDGSINLGYALLPGIRKYNREKVYGNTTGRDRKALLFDPF